MPQWHECLELCWSVACYVANCSRTAGEHLAPVSGASSDQLAAAENGSGGPAEGGQQAQQTEHATLAQDLLQAGDALLVAIVTCTAPTS